MTEEQYNEAIKIHDRLGELEEALKAIKGTDNHKLSYLEKRSNGNYDSIVSEYSLRPIGDILDRHDIAIREEISDEIGDCNTESKNSRTMTDLQAQAKGCMAYYPKESERR